MVGVARHAVADHLGVYPGAACARVLVFLQHHDAAAFAHHEAVAGAVPRPRGPFRRIVERRGQRAGGAKARHAELADGAFGAAGHHDVGIVERDHARGVAYGVRARCAGGDGGVRGPAQMVLNGDVSRRQIDQVGRDEERRQAPLAAIFQRPGRCLDAGQAADAGTDHHAAAFLFRQCGRRPAGIAQRFGGGGDGVDDEGIHFLQFLALDPVFRTKAAFLARRRQLPGDARRQVGGRETVQHADAAVAGQQPLPGALGANCQRGQHADAGDDHAAQAERVGQSVVGRRHRSPFSKLNKAEMYQQSPAVDPCRK